MNNFEIITVATHESGTFNKLINNKFRTKIKVLGWNQKWEGFSMKYKLVLDYINKLEKEKIVIFLDGFDTLIINDPIIAVKKFVDKDYKVLFSKENEKSNLHIFKKIIFKNIFSSNSVINSGLYMGYVKYLKTILEDAICDKCKDDQVVINKNNDKYNYLSIDEDNEIFLNIDKNQLEKYENSKNNENSEHSTLNSPIFIQTPGIISFDRILYRGIFEYCQFFIIYVLVISIIINFVSIIYTKSKCMAE